MRYIIVLFLLTFSFLHPMERVSLLKKNLQQESKDYFVKTLPSSKLSKFGKYYDKLSVGCQGKVILRMSDQLLTLHCVALWLPTDLQRCIVAFMLDGYKTDQKERNKKIDLAVEKFYNKKTIVKAFQLLCDIKQHIKEDNPIFPLYAMRKKNRNMLLSTLDPWYGDYINPLVSIEERQWIDELDEDERSSLRGKQVNILPSDDRNICTKKNHLLMGGSLAGLVLLAEGVTTGIMYGIGGKAILCNSGFLGASVGLWGLLPFVYCISAGRVGLDCWHNDVQKETL